MNCITSVDRNTLVIDLAPVVQNLYPVERIAFPNTYPFDSDLSGGQRYPTFKQLGPDWSIKS